MLVIAPGTRALAQQPPPQGQGLEEITVTGSRIQRRDNSSNSPIVTIEADAFQAQNGLNFEAYLNQLPEYNPAASPTTSQSDVQITPVNSVGIASISLRGFGPNRNLVLVDGKRTVPINALMVTDVNSIPSALIQRVETITGGASAVYGADAVGGVTNFILRDNFEGLEVDSQYGSSENGDGAERRVSAVFGANLSDGKGNISVGVEHYNRDAVYAANLDAYKDLYNDPLAPGYFLFLQGTTHFNCLFNCPGTGTVNGVFQPQAGENVFNPNSGNVFRQFVFNGDGTVFVPNSQAGIRPYTGAANFNFYPQTIFDASVPGNTTTMQGLKWENPQQLVSAPQQRYSLFLTSHYDMSDRLTLYARANLAESETRTSLFGTNAIFGWEGTVPFDPTTDSPLNPALDYTDPAVVAAALADPTNPAYVNTGFIPSGAAGAQHPVPAQLAALLLGRPDPMGDWLPGWSPDSSLPPRSTVNTNTVWQVEAGLDFKLGNDWSGEFYLSHGQSSTYNNANGNMSLTRYRQLIRTPDYGRNAVIQGNANGASPGFGAARVTCTSGFYDTFFAGDQPLSQDCFDAVNAVLQTRAQNKQDIAELNFEGPLAQLKAGEIRGAFGYQKRNNSAAFVPDILQSTVSFTDQVIGVYPTGYLDASTSADDIYFETLIPLVADKKAARRFELEIGARSSKYEHTDSENTWKTLFRWEINDWFSLRGGFNRATRAPNLGELFLNPQQVFTIGGNNYGDPCGLRSTAPFGAGGTGNDPQLDPGETQPTLAAGQTAAGAMSARMICEALMGPTAANQFYNVANAPAGGGSAFNWVLQQGNPDLHSETADTWTFGFVTNLPFKKPLLSNINLTFDAYQIDIKDAIMLFSVDYANYRCYGSVLVTTPAEAADQAASPACQLVPRNQALGGPLTTNVSYDNQATINTAGADIALNWRVQFSDFGSKLKGGLAFNMQANVLDYYRTKQSPADFDVETDWKGSLGPNLTGTNPGAYDYRLFSTLTYFRDTWSVSLRWRGLPSVWTDDYASQRAIIQNNERVAAGAPGLILSYVPGTGGTGTNPASPEIKTDSYRVFDLSFTYDLASRVSLRGGITNLLDEKPPLSGATMGYTAADLASACGGVPGCVPPQLPALPNDIGSFSAYNGGFYDTVGRRYFLGVDIKF